MPETKDLAAQFVTFARQGVNFRFIPWDVMRAGLITRGVGAAAAGLAIEQMRDGIDGKVPWPTLEGIVRDILGPTPKPPDPNSGVTERNGRKVVYCNGNGVVIDTPRDEVVLENTEYVCVSPDAAFCEGLRVLQPVKHLEVIDCIFRGFGVGWNLVPLSGARIPWAHFFRSMALDTINGQSLYAHGVDHLRVQQSVLDGAGWRPGHPEDKTDFDHNAYINNGNGLVEFSETWLANPASYLMELRCGGRVKDCFGFLGPNGLRGGAGGNAFPIEPGGVRLEVDNLVLLGRPAPPNVHREGMVTLSNIAGGWMRKVVLAGPIEGTSGWPVLLACDRPDAGVGVRDFELDIDVVSWAGEGPRFDGPPGSIVNVNKDGVRMRAGGPSLSLDAFAQRLAMARERVAGTWDETNSPRSSIKLARSVLGL